MSQFTRTKHSNLTQAIRQEIRRVGAGRAMSTVAELKSRFGVSQATVSRALEGLRKEGLIYRPPGRKRLYVSEVGAKGLRRLLVVRSTFPSPDYDAIMRELLGAARVYGWAIETQASQWEVESLDFDRLAEGYDAMILACSSGAFSEGLLNGLRQPKCPVVLVRELPDDPTIPGVSVDNVRAGELATEYLASLGHRGILGVICEPLTKIARDRIQGWRQAMAKIGCPDPERMLIDCAVSPGQDSIGQTWEHFRAWMRNPARPEFTAIFTVDWTGALAVMRVLREDWNLAVPGDVSLISYAGETPIAPFLQPPLTTVAADLREVAEQCLYMLEAQLRQGKSNESQTKVPPFIVERQSTRRVGESVWPAKAKRSQSGEDHVKR